MFIGIKDYVDHLHKMATDRQESVAKLVADQTVAHDYLTGIKRLPDDDEEMFKARLAQAEKAASKSDSSLAKVSSDLYNDIKKDIGNLARGNNKDVPTVDSIDELHQLIVFLTNFSYYPNDTTLMLSAIDYLSMDLAIGAVQDAGFVSDQPKLAAYLSTHNTKLIATDFTALSFYTQPPLLSEGIAGADVAPVRKLDQVGGAGYMKLSQLMYTEFSYGDRMSSVYEAVKGYDEVLFADLCTINPEFTTFFQTVRDSLTGARKKEAPAPSLQMLIPTDEGYVAITPIANVGFSRVFHDKLDKIRSDESSFVRSHAFLVGGTKPLNAGRFNNFRSGRNRALLAQLPAFGLTDRDRLIKRYIYANTLLKPIAANDYSSLRLPLEFKQQKKRFVMALPYILSATLERLSDVKILKEEGALKDVAAANLNENEMKLINGDINTDDSIDECAWIFVNSLIDELPDSQRPIIGHQDRLPLFQKAMRTLVKSFSS